MEAEMVTWKRGFLCDRESTRRVSTRSNSRCPISYPEKMQPVLNNRECEQVFFQQGKQRNNRVIVEVGGRGGGGRRLTPQKCCVKTERKETFSAQSRCQCHRVRIHSCVRTVRQVYFLAFEETQNPALPHTVNPLPTPLHSRMLSTFNRHKCCESSMDINMLYE